MANELTPVHKRSLIRIAVITGVLVLAPAISYFSVAYEFVPMAWRFVERRHPALDSIGTRAFTSAGIPGDPLNVAFVGSEDALHKKMLGAGWYPADPITLRSSLRIARDSLLHKPYPDAPVSDLFVNGQKQSYAFEQAEGGNPSKRHHVRFWRTPDIDALDRPMWIGAATFDSGVGLSHTTGQITHHIAAEVDRERDKLITDLQHSGEIVLRWIEPFQKELEGRNGGGDKFKTDGRLVVFSEQ
ncbi:LssY C-terminal domain-containing protein [Solimicrobium silvestre]|uniref:LssY C-terminus n=1 Tax=Solimicrobium silvestre TaxID=2099400 RepID=A0A2S9H4T7_9BURK|nr:LssY C-terminal domain-containing protein [Solimicrobium silvestre]PRC94977.1 LssY C-terminus [Solimicrobium silvestre]